MKSSQWRKIIPLMIDEQKFRFFVEEEIKELEEEDEECKKGSSDGIVHEARVFERLNVNLRSASDVKSQSHD